MGGKKSTDEGGVVVYGDMGGDGLYIYSAWRLAYVSDLVVGKINMITSWKYV